MAARRGNADLVRLYLKKGASPHVSLPYHEGESEDYLMAHTQPLLAVVHHSVNASAESVLKIVSLLLVAGADPLVRDCCGRTAVWMALVSGHVKAAELIFDAALARHQDVATLEAGLPAPEESFGSEDHEEDCSENGDPLLPLLHVAAAAGSVHIVRELLAHSEEPALIAGRALDSNVDLGVGGARGDTALHFACDMHFVDNCLMMDLVPEHLTEKRCADQLLIVRALLEHGADPLAINRRGETPLHRLCSDTASGEIVGALLLSAGSAASAKLLDAKDCEGHTPLQVACAKKRSRVVEALARVENCQSGDE